MPKPLIGICPDLREGPPAFGQVYYLYSRYVSMVSLSGGLPVILPVVATRDEARELLERVEGLILTGGGDIDPAHYGQQARDPARLAIRGRTSSDFAYAREAKDRGMAVLGICLGIQTLNVSFGGTLLQHIPDDVPGALDHAGKGSPDHPIRIEPNTILKRALGVESIQVNSYHHQAIGEVAPGFRIAARSPDGIIEAIERTDHPFFVGVHWHPERMLESEATRRLLRAFVDATRGAWAPAS